MGWGKKKKVQARKAVVVAKLPEPEEIEVTVDDVPAPESEVYIGTSTIGATVRVNGELSGDEDVVVHGRVDGTVQLSGNDLTVGPTGRVHAEIHAASVVVEGEVVGNITAEGRVEVAASGSIQGDIRAGRVVLSDGARFRGRIDMGPEDEGSFFDEQRDEEPASPFVSASDDVLSKFD